MNRENTLPQTGFIRLPTILQLIPISKTTWWDGIKKGRFPKPVKIGPRVSAWPVEDIRALMESFSNQSQSTTTVSSINN